MSINLFVLFLLCIFDLSKCNNATQQFKLKAMFENITKGVWSIDQQKVKVNKHGTTVFPLRIDTEPMCFTNVARIYEPEANRQNAEFIAYCFNLQQRFDISKLEEAIEMLEICSNTNVINHYHERIADLLTKIRR